MTRHQQDRIRRHRENPLRIAAAAGRIVRINGRTAIFMWAKARRGGDCADHEAHDQNG